MCVLLLKVFVYMFCLCVDGYVCVHVCVCVCVCVCVREREREREREKGVCRNLEKEFPLQINDCNIRVVYFLTALLEYLNVFTQITIQNNGTSVAIV